MSQLQAYPHVQSLFLVFTVSTSLPDLIYPHLKMVLNASNNKTNMLVPKHWPPLLSYLSFLTNSVKSGLQAGLSGHLPRAEEPVNGGAGSLLTPLGFSRGS